MVMVIVLVACARPSSHGASSPGTQPPPPHPAWLPNGDLLVDEDGLPTGELIVWAPMDGEEVLVEAEIRMGDLSHSWMVGRVSSGDGETVLPISVPPEGVLTTLQEFAMSDVYISLVRSRPGGRVVDQNIPELCVVWSWGFEQPPAWYTNAQARALWPGGVVGVVGEPGAGTWRPANEVREWIEVNP